MTLVNTETGEIVDIDRGAAERRAQTTAYYKGWKPQYDAWLPVLFRNPTIGAAVLAGDLPAADTLFAAS